MNAVTTPVSSERLAELIAACESIQERLIEAFGISSPEVAETVSAETMSIARELQQLRARETWVPWKQGDALPPDGRYWCSFGNETPPELRGPWAPRNFALVHIKFYWPIALPAPYRVTP